MVEKKKRKRKEKGKKKGKRRIYVEIIAPPLSRNKLVSCTVRDSAPIARVVP